ncbi:hypothetical protein AeNC1_018790, partial [Aphanomyces euteiches]
VTKQLMVAEDALITHLGVYFCRPSESPKELQDSLNARKAICRTLLRNLPSLQFTHPMEAPPRRRSTYRPWTLEMAQHMRRLLEAIVASPAKKRDLFLRLTDSSLVSQVVDPSYAGPVDAMSVHTLAGALKLMLQRTDALVGRDVFSFARSSDSPVADLSRAVLALDPTRKRLVLLLWRCIQQALIDGASLELLSSALSGHIFEELKPPRDPSANHMLDRTAIEVLKNLDTLLRLCCPRFRSVALVVLTAQRWLAACRERNASFHRAAASSSWLLKTGSAWVDARRRVVHDAIVTDYVENSVISIKVKLPAITQNFLMPPPPPHLPALARAQCDVLVAFVNHLVAYKAHKTKLFQYEGKPSERKKLLEMFYNGASPTTAALKHVSSRSMSYVIRHVLSTQYAPLLPYAAFQTLATAVQSPAIRTPSCSMCSVISPTRSVRKPLIPATLRGFP